MLKYILIIAFIFLILILGQQVYFKNLGKEYLDKIQAWGNAQWQKAQDYWDKHILNKVTDEVEKRQNIAKEEIKGQAKQVTQTVWEKVKGYVTGIFNSIFNKVPTEPSTTTPSVQ